MARTVKRAGDLLLGGVSLLALAVPFAVTACLIRIGDRDPALFRQQCAAKDGRAFRVWKFRAMVVDAMSKGLGVTVAKDDERFTRVGKLLRAWGSRSCRRFSMSSPGR